MSARLSVHFPLALLVFAAAGCTSPASPDRLDWTATASDPLLLAPPGTPYDGSGIRGGTGTWAINTMDQFNQGTVDVDFTIAGHHYVIHWTDFHEQPNAAWQDGGVKTHYPEHGATGHGNKMEPEFHVLSGGWGTASGTLDGQPIADPTSGGTTLNAHYMLTENAMLEEGTHKVYKSDRKTPFDPMNPGDGYVFPGRMEAHFALWGGGVYKDGIAVTAPTPAIVIAKDTVTSPQYSKSTPIPVPAANSVLTVETKASSGQAGQITATLKDPMGKAVWTGGGVAAKATVPGPTVAGNYTLEVSGDGIQYGYEYDVTVAPPVPLLVHVVFTQVKVT